MAQYVTWTVVVEDHRPEGSVLDRYDDAGTFSVTLPLTATHSFFEEEGTTDHAMRLDAVARQEGA